MSFDYRKDQEGPAIGVNWAASDGSIYAFASGWTFAAKVCAVSAPTTIIVTKSSGITGADTYPNVSIAWSASDFSTLTASATGVAYVVYLYATRTADSKDFVFRPSDPIRLSLFTAPA